MKPHLRTLLALGALALALPTRAAEPDPELAARCRSARSVFLHDIARESVKWDGQIVKLKWAGRDGETQRDGDWLLGSAYAGGAWHRLRVPAAGEAWFLRIKPIVSFSQNAPMQVAYARLSVSGGIVTAELLGRELKITSRGAELQW